ncbi:hypothetical protein C8R46DRAFT_1043644 [Mycena filopes]|nr:hypothetical protein C8R46DRAFT_1043644 [Mycena filopes]
MSWKWSMSWKWGQLGSTRFDNEAECAPKTRSRDVDTYSSRCSRCPKLGNIKRDGLRPHPARAGGLGVAACRGSGMHRFSLGRGLNSGLEKLSLRSGEAYLVGRGGGNGWMSVRKRWITKRLSEHSKLPRPSETREERKKRVGGGVYPDGLRGSLTPTDSVASHLPPRLTVSIGQKRKEGAPGGPLRVAFAPGRPNLPRAGQEKKPRALPDSDSTPLASQKGRRFAIWFTQVSVVGEKFGKKTLTYSDMRRRVDDTIETRRRVLRCWRRCAPPPGSPKLTREVIWITSLSESKWDVPAGGQKVEKEAEGKLNKVALERY